MKQTSRIIPTYTADVSGVCSALFELGGMTIMHDASGCNSTYNTHDEPRWYDSESLVFISALTEIDAIMGNDEKLINDIVSAAEELKPNFIAIAGTPSPMMMGTDLPAVAQVVEKRSGIPAFGFSTNGMHSYVSGAGQALAKVIGRLAKTDVAKVPNSVNLLGVTPLDFTVNGMVESMREVLEAEGYHINAVAAMGNNFDEILNIGKGAVNLVVSYVGMPLAKELKKKFGTPFVVATPYEGLASEIVNELKIAEESGNDSYALQKRTGDAQSDLVLIGESVTMCSLAWAIEKKYGRKARVISPVETNKAVLKDGDRYLRDEEDIEKTLQGAKQVIADPQYQGILPQECNLIPLGHEGFSGRIYRKSIPNLVKEIPFVL